MIDADAQNLGIQSRELGVFGLVGRDLPASNGCPGQREEGKDDVLPPQMTQGDLLVQLAGQRELRSFLTDLQLHALVPSHPNNRRRNAIVTAIGPTAQEALWNPHPPSPAMMPLGRSRCLNEAIERLAQDPGFAYTNCPRVGHGLRASQSTRFQVIRRRPRTTRQVQPVRRDPGHQEKGGQNENQTYPSCLPGNGYQHRRLVERWAVVDWLSTFRQLVRAPIIRRNLAG